MTKRRMIHDKIWRSKNNLRLDMRQRLLFIGLFSCADDQGRIEGHPALIKAEVFPYDDITADELQADLDVITDIGAIICYDADSTTYIQIKGWWNYQRPQWAQPSSIPAQSGWQDRIRYRLGGVVLTYNWCSPVEHTPADTCDRLGKPLPKPLPKALPKPLPSRDSISISDSGSDSGSDSKDLAASAEKTPPLPEQDNTVIPKSEQDRVRRAYEQCFCDLTGLSPPATGSGPQEKAAGKFWYAPLRRIVNICEWDEVMGKHLIQMTIEKMDGDGLTISNPNSILKTAEAILAEGKRGRNPNGKDPAGLAGLNAWMEKRGLTDG